MRKALFGVIFIATVVWAGPSMEGGTNKVVRSVDNAGGDSSTSATSRLVGSVAEEVAFTTATSAANTVRAGWSQIHAFPKTVSDLGGTDIYISSVNLQWSTPGYDGQDGTLQVGSTYFIRVASYTVPDTFSDHRLANISFSTSGVVPGEIVSIGLLGLLSGTTYWARIWTTDGDSDISYASNLSSFTTAGVPAPSGGTIVSASSLALTATWAPEPDALNYILIVSTEASFTPVAGSSATAATTATISGLDPNTTYYAAAASCPGCSGFTFLGSTITQASPAVALSSTAISSSTISLAWNPQGNPAGTRFVIRRSTDNIDFISVATVTLSTAGLIGLTNDTTYYFTVIALNAAGTPALPSNLLVVTTPIGPVPLAPADAAATAILLGVDTTWGLAPGGDGAGLLFYRLSRSTNAGFGYVSYTTTTATSYRDRPLELGPTYYYRISTRDIGQVEGPFAQVSALPFTYTPMEPLGVKIAAAPLTVALSWSTTTRYGDGSLFLSTTTPLADELIGYSVYRSTEICAPSFVNVSSLPYTTHNLVDNTGGLNYYYRVHSYNTLGLSSNAVTMSTLGERSYFLDDCVSRVVMDDATAATLNADVNGIGDIRIDRKRIAEDVGDATFQSVAFTPMLNGTTPLKDYSLPKPVRVVLAFETAGGVPFAPAAAPVAGSGVTVKNLGLFWYNGAEFKKVYGVVDPVSQTVTVHSPNLGFYQIRALARSDGAVFDVSNISGRAITPNGDGINDQIIFTYDPGRTNEAVTGRIYDVVGAFVADMRSGFVPNTLTWDGRSNGRVVGGGAYIYKVQGGGKTYTGTIVVAR